MARRRRRKSPRRIWIVGSLATIAGVWSYGHFVSPVLEGDAPSRSTSNGATDQVTGGSNQRSRDIPRLTSSRPEVPDGGAGRHVSEKGENDAPHAGKPHDPERVRQAQSLLAAGAQAVQRGDLLAARAYYSEAVDGGLDDQQLLDARAALARIGGQTVFSGAIVRGDPFVRRHVISPGETLGAIAKRYSVTADFLAAINNIPDKNQVRAGQTIKVVQGPFHARIDKKTFRMDVYLQNTYVKHYAVGLGAEDSTPSGEWLVGTMLTNPTFYPPRGGAIVAADDPENPLGEHWIGIKGIGGDAVGQERYGIHGTIEPDSVGRSESLGCIRLHNADVSELYTLLVPGKSHVTIE